MTDTPLYLSPIASPLADEKLADKLLKLTKKGACGCARTRMAASSPRGPAAAKAKFLKRGVKEVVKGIRKGDKGCAAGRAARGDSCHQRRWRPPQLHGRLRSPAAAPSPTRLVILAGNVSPIDVITHIPVMCEEADIPYIYVPAKVRPLPRRPTARANAAAFAAPPPISRAPLLTPRFLRSGCSGRGGLHQAAHQRGHGDRQGRV